MAFLDTFMDFLDNFLSFWLGDTCWVFWVETSYGQDVSQNDVTRWHFVNGLILFLWHCSRELPCFQIALMPWYHGGSSSIICTISRFSSYANWCNLPTSKARHGSVALKGTIESKLASKLIVFLFYVEELEFFQFSDKFQCHGLIWGNFVSLTFHSLPT